MKPFIKTLLTAGAAIGMTALSPLAAHRTFPPNP